MLIGVRPTLSMIEEYMKKAYDTIVAMRNTSSKLDKIALLSKQKDNAFLQEYLRLVYEPRVNFYVKKIDPKLRPQNEGEPSFHMNMELLNALKATICVRKVTGGKAREMLSLLYNSLCEEWECDMLTWLIGRDVKAGFNAGTISKVWPVLLTDVPYMRCALPKDTDLAKWPWKDGVHSQMKCDGMFANVTHRRDGSVTIESRSGSPFPIEMFGDVVTEVRENVPKCKQMHGELLMYDADGKVMPRQISNGRFNSLLQGGELPKDGSRIVYVAWDIIPEVEARAKNKYRVKYFQRFHDLETYIVGRTGPALQLVEYKIVTSLAEAYEHYKELLAAGFEGSIIKRPDMIWEDTTSKGQIKLKLDVDVDLEIVSFTEGNGKNAKTFGSIQCKTSEGLMVVGVSGFSDEMRQEFSDDRANMIGKIMTVKSNCIMKPSKEGGQYSLFLPRFEELRLDKKVADSLERVIQQFDNAIK